MSANKKVEVGILSENEINERKLQILKAIISDYVSTGEPVGSRTLARKYNLGISPATIRNEMSDLEEMGFLEQPHTSAGRIPSSKGYRIYVDRLMPAEKKDPSFIPVIQNQILNLAAFEIDKIIRGTSQILSELTNMAIIASTPSARKVGIRTIQLVSLGSHNLMVVIVLDNSQVRNTVIRTEEMPHPGDLLMLSNLLTMKLSRLSVEQINIGILDSVRKDLSGYRTLFASVLSAVYEALTKDEDEFIVEGKSNILNFPEFNSIEKAKEIFLTLENPDELMENFEKSLGEGEDDSFRIFIGDETDITDNKDLSIISAKYQLNGEDVGTINLLGPKRLDYSKVTTILTQVVEELNKKLSNLSKEDEDG